MISTITGLVLVVCTSMESGFTYGILRGYVLVEVEQVSRIDLDCLAEPDGKGVYKFIPFNRKTHEILEIKY